MWWRSVIWTGVIFGTFFALLPNILWCLAWCVGRLFSYRLPYAPFGWTALALVLLIWEGLIYGCYIGRFLWEVNELTFSSPEVPEAFDGYRMVHISDLHVDSFEDARDLKHVLERVNEQQADIILFTGDMTTGSMDGIRRHEEVLRSLRAKDGVVSVLGNHDFFIYDRQYRTDAERCAAADRLTCYEHDALGWKVLRNTSLLLHRGADSIAIAGVDNINGNQGFSTIQMGDLGKAMQGLDGVFTVLLSHDPSHWQAEVLPRSHAQITLSGHTHAAQVRLFGWSLARLSFRENDGRYDQDGRMLYVNAGIGCTAPFRIGCPSEITVITLRKQKPLTIPPIERSKEILK